VDAPPSEPSSETSNESGRSGETGVAKWAYAAPSFAIAFVGIPVYVYLPKFYTDVVGVNIAVVGWILLGARMFDAVTDPAVGAISDRTHTRWGRRRPYILGASVPLAASIFLLLTPPESIGATAAAWWFGVMLAVMFLAWTVLVVPYESLGPELTFDYHQRTEILGTRDGMLIVGTVVAAASPVIVSKLLGLADDASGERTKFAYIGAIYAPLVIALSAWCVARVRERKQKQRDALGFTNLKEGLSAMRDNRAFWTLLSAYTLGTVGFNLAGGLLLYYVRYVLSSDRADVFLVVYLVAGVVCLPAWIKGAEKLDKRRIWLAGMAIYAVGGIGIFFLGEGDEILYGALCVVTGLTFGANVAIPNSMLADVIDYDELLTHERREGVFLGIWAVIRKLAAALGVGVALPILEATGYEPNSEQPSATKLAIRLLYVGVPVVCNLLAIVIAWRYPIDKKEHARIRGAIDARSAQSAESGASS